MLETILMSKAFSTAKKYWQVIAGAVAVIGTFIVKAIYDKNLKKEVIKEVENVARETMYREQEKLNEVSESTIINHANNPLPSSWDELGKLSEKASPSAKSKVAKDKILKKLRRKD